MIRNLATGVNGNYRHRVVRVIIDIAHNSSSTDEETLKTLWENTSTTADVKMQQLYDLSLDVSSGDPTEKAPYRSIAMSYSEHEQMLRSGQRDRYMEWFFRDTKDRLDSTLKRPQGVDLQDARKSHSKKRKIRDNKKVGVDSLLGSFM